MDTPTAGELFSVSCAVLWAAATVLFRRSGETVPPLALNLFKNTVGLALFVVTLLILGIPFFPAAGSAEDWAVLLASGAVGIGVADTLFFASLNRLGAGGLAIVSCLYSPVVVFSASVHLGEPLGPAVLAATALMAGAIVVGTWQPWDPARTPADRRRVVSGVALGIVSEVLMAVAVVAAKPVLERSDPWWATVVRMVGGMAVLALQVLSPARRADVVRAFRPGRGWGVAVPAAVLGAYVAMILWIVGFKYTFAGTASILNQTSAIFTLILGAVFLRERVTGRKAVGIAMAFAGAVIAVA